MLGYQLADKFVKKSKNFKGFHVQKKTSTKEIVSNAHGGVIKSPTAGESGGPSGPVVVEHLSDDDDCLSLGSKDERRLEIEY
jgi:hypothetical protein